MKTIIIAATAAIATLGLGACAKHDETTNVSTNDVSTAGDLNASDANATDFGSNLDDAGGNGAGTAGDAGGNTSNSL